LPQQLRNRGAVLAPAELAPIDPHPGIRREHFVKGKSIKEIVRELKGWSQRRSASAKARSRRCADRPARTRRRNELGRWEMVRSAETGIGRLATTSLLVTTFPNSPQVPPAASLLVPSGHIVLDNSAPLRLAPLDVAPPEIGIGKIGTLQIGTLQGNTGEVSHVPNKAQTGARRATLAPRVRGTPQRQTLRWATSDDDEHYVYGIAL
jgi:hypothetical protein